PTRRTSLLERQPLRAKKAHTYEAEFDRLTRTGRRFKPKDIDWDGHRFRMSEYVLLNDSVAVPIDVRRFKPKDIDWDGYRVVQENIFTHPKSVWSEHRAVLKQD